MAGNKYSLKERLRYGFDNAMSKGLVALIGLLGLASLAFILVMATIVTIFRLNPDDRELDFGEAFWSSLLRTLDPGTMGQDTGMGFRPAMLIVTLGGLILVASLISVIANAFNSRIDQLRDGRSRVLESGHILVLGWSTKVVPVVRELCEANKGGGKNVIVVMADRDAIEMEGELARRVRVRHKTRIIVRRGDPTSLSDLAMVNPNATKSIILLSPTDMDDPDTLVLSTCMALVNNPNRRPEPFSIVGEIRDAEHIETAKLIGKNEGHWVLASDLISRITVQTLRQGGLSTIVTELLDFEGNEIYIVDMPEAVGMTYGHIQMALERACAIGVLRDDKTLLNPAASLLITAGDSLVVIADTPRDIALGSAAPWYKPGERKFPALRKRVEHSLILGYNHSVPFMLSELDEYVAAKSSVTLLSRVEQPTLPKLKNIAVKYVQDDTTKRKTLDALKIANFDHISVCAYDDEPDANHADAITLVTLLHLRDIARQGGHQLNIVSEMLNDKNREIAEVTNADDFIVSDKLVSLLLAQVATNFHLTDVFTELFSSAGSEIYVRPAKLYCTPGEEVSFYDLVERAQVRGETVIGYRSGDSRDASNIVINPVKTTALELGEGDDVIVLAEQ
ncbi:MAG: hypothetical protein RLZZ600_1106 [Actinomycetota bacterium]|jgi:Trk K+ transport system NAD-binding subunit